ncbi:tyrosine-type recombinase/integrase [Fictibacillus sp. BK138]|uniref:tyrosine-type recombinase/integrase n=1 Tax=Fictibacillus sp. BK138 TaxID=2512121 RepID=UPI0010291737|nr:tyrosine-type recombinase/integrase [Fictibacillus sp. BK138]RZT23138.1 site-specific recombinase XerC [Fictibacillus sp. BK138]
MLVETLQKEFLIERKFEGLRESTLTVYKDFFKSWNEWLNTQSIEQVEDISPLVIKQYLRRCADNGNKPKTINTKLKLLRAFSRWLVEESLVDQQFTKGVKAVREDSVPKIVRQEDIQLVLSHLRRVKRSRRNYVLVLFMIGTGCRLSEIERLNWTDIDFTNSLITILESKTRKHQSVPLSDTLARELLDWKLFVDKKFNKPPQPLFTTRNGTRITKNGIQNFFKRLKKTLEIQGDFSTHCMRNFYIKGLLKNGANLREVQLLARHSKIQVTQGYIGYFAHELKETIDQSNPLNDLI